MTYDGQNKQCQLCVCIGSTPCRCIIQPCPLLMLTSIDRIKGPLCRESEAIKGDPCLLQKPVVDQDIIYSSLCMLCLLLGILLFKCMRFQFIPLMPTPPTPSPNELVEPSWKTQIQKKNSTLFFGINIDQYWFHEPNGTGKWKYLHIFLCFHTSSLGFPLSPMQDGAGLYLDIPTQCWDSQWKKVFCSSKRIALNLQPTPQYSHQQTQCNQCCYI